MYDMMCARLLCLVVGLVIPFQNNPRHAHWQNRSRGFSVIYMEQYLYALISSRRPKCGYSDTNYGGNLDEHRLL